MVVHMLVGAHMLVPDDLPPLSKMHRGMVVSGVQLGLGAGVPSLVSQHHHFRIE
jgi:hypothetical protein